MSRRSSIRGRALAAAVAGAGLVLGSGQHAGAVDYSWNTGSGTFQTPANWSSSAPGTFPNDSSDNAIFGAGNPGYTVSFAGSVTNNYARVSFDILTFDLNFNIYTLTASSLFSSSLTVGGMQLGELTITDGTVAGVAASVGVSAGVDGLVTIPSGGVLSLSGSATIGNSGIGTVNLNGGDFAHSGITLGAAATATGTMIVSGTTGSALGNGQLTVGSIGDGILLVENGGDVSFSSCVMASAEGSTGEMTVVGGSSTVNGSGTLNVGVQGEAGLTIRNGGVVVVGSTIVANNFGSRGDLLVSGAGATFNANGSATIGSFGAAIVRVENGGVVNTSAATNFASSVSGSANVTLSGSGAEWTAGSDVTVGGSGTSAGGSAVLTIGSGALFRQLAGNFRILGPGTVNLNGGTLAVNQLFVSGALNFNSGTLRHTSSMQTFMIGASGPFGTTLSLDKTRHVEVSFNAAIDVGALLELKGGTFAAGTMANFGEIRLADSASTLSGTLNNGGLVAGNGRIHGALNNVPSGEIRASWAADRLLFTGFAGSNNGTINALGGGTVEFSAALSNNSQILLTEGILKTGGLLDNNPGGRIAGRGALLTGGIQNDGDIVLSAGLSDVVGNLANSSTGELVVTGGGTATFYNNVTSSAGAVIRVSDNSTAVFLGSVSGPATYQGSGTKIFEGPFSATDTLATPGSTIVEASASLTSTHIREASLTVAGNVTIAPNGTATGTSRLGALVVHDGGRLDLKDNKLIVVGGELGTWMGSAYDGIAGLVDSGRGGGGNPIWTGDGIVTSDTRAIGTNDFASLGVATAGQLGRTTFGGLSVGPADVLVMLTYGGDANLDGKINIDDYGRIDGNVGQSGSVFGWFNGDFNYDGKINIDDYGIIDGNINQQGPPLSTIDGVSAVPEPGAAIVLWVAPILMSARRRKRPGGQSSGTSGSNFLISAAGA